MMRSDDCMKNLLRTIPFLSENCRYGSPLQRTFRRARLFLFHSQPARETAAPAGGKIFRLKYRIVHVEEDRIRAAYLRTDYMNERHEIMQ